MKLLITLAILGEMAIWTVILLPIVFANMALSTKNTGAFAESKNETK